MNNFFILIYNKMYYTTKDVYEFIGQQGSDPITDWKTCKVSGQEFPIFQSDIEFYDKISPIFNGKKYQIPTPTFCLEERKRRRLLRRNLMKLYRRKCDASWENIISIYSPDKPYKVFDQKIWRSDVYNPLEYWMDFDFSQPFFPQFKQLQLKVPRCSLLNGYGENAEYINHSYYNKDCYLAFGLSYSENCFYGDWGIYDKYCLDFSYIYNCEQCYEMIKCNRCYDCQYLINCDDCSYVYYSQECKNCKNCIGCYGLNNASYKVYNEQVSPEVFEEMKAGMMHKAQERTIIAIKANDICKSGIKPATYSSELQSAFGVGSHKAKNCKCVVDWTELENVSYSSELRNAKDCHDFDIWWENASRIYEVHCAWWNVDTILFSSVIWNGNNVFYSDNCLSNAKNCFGCVGLKQNEYCIFNKQYTKEEYEVLVAKIIEHMQSTGERGEFFDASASPFAYNETVAQDYFPLNKEEAMVRGYTRQDNNYDTAIPEGVETLKGDQIPSDITTVTDEILKKILICEVTWRPFRIIKSELDFYRKHHVSLPRKHPDIRHQNRIHKRLSRALHLRTCDKCGITMLSVYQATYEWKVYCEDCYNKEIYW